MGKNYDTDAERITVEAWKCKTCGRLYVVNDWTDKESEDHARRCCSRNAPCRGCGERIQYSNSLCRSCIDKRERERWEKCEVKPLEFPLFLQDDDRFFRDENDLLDYCCNNDVDPGDLLLRIGKQHSPRFFDPGDFWCDDMPEDDDLTEGDSECADLTEKINDWAKENIITYEMGPFRPDVSGLERTE
jgi:hypothetical protein